MAVSVGVNISDMYRQQAREWQAAAEHARRKAIDSAITDQYVTKDVHYCIGYTRGNRYQLETIEPFIKAGILRSSGTDDPSIGRDGKKEAVAKMHMVLAHYYQFRKACPTFDECLERAANATIKVAEWIPR